MSQDVHPFSLQGEVALVTGGGTGLGQGIARCLTQAGARVIIVGRREAELQRAAAEIGPKTCALCGDVTQFDDVASVVSRAEVAAGGPISILVNNAGIHLKKPAVETSVTDFSAVLNTHVLGAHAMSQAVLPGMTSRGRGSIVFIASMTSFMGIPNVIAYSAAKSAYVGMVRSLATEVSAQGVRVNAVAPGWIESPMLRKALDGDPKRRDRILARTPMGGFGSPDDIGNAVVYLCSPAARFVTGVVLPVDGGASIGF